MNFEQAFIDELEKLAVVPGPIKQARRHLAALHTQLPQHRTSTDNIRGIVEQNRVKPGSEAGSFGKGAYWNKRSVHWPFPDNKVVPKGMREMFKKPASPQGAFGSVGVTKEVPNRNIKSTHLMRQFNKDWRIDQRKRGTPLSRKDTVFGIPSEDRDTRRLARSNGLRVVGADSARAAEQAFWDKKPIDGKSLMRENRLARKSGRKV